MPFKFSLAAVLRLRESVEEREKRALEKMQHEIVQTLQSIEKLDIQFREAVETREQAMQQAVPAFHLLAIEDARRAIKCRKEEMIARLAKLNTEREKQLLAYESARREREVLSDMRGRQSDAYQIAESRQQQKAIDDLFGARQKRK